MPKKRNSENRGLPERWRKRGNAYYYRVPPGKEHLWDGKTEYPLGTGITQAYATWAEKIGTIQNIHTIGQLLDRYKLEIIPKKPPTSRNRETSSLGPLKATFGKMPITQLKPRHIYQYYEKRKIKTTDEDGKSYGGPSAAKHDIAVLSNAYNSGVKWGIIDAHPFKGQVVIENSAARTRYIEDWEIIECLSMDSKRSKGSINAIQAYIRIKLLTGLRAIDLLRLEIKDLGEVGIDVTPSKTKNSTGKAITIRWSDELRAAVEMAKEARPVDISPWLFCNRRGECYYPQEASEPSGWKSMWQRFMKRLLEETEVSERFTEHDLRAKCASDTDSLEHAQKLLAHADSKTTAKFYRRKREIVEPLR